MKICQVAEERYHAGGRAGINLTVPFRNVTNAPTIPDFQEQCPEDTTCVLLAECGDRREHEPRMEFANLPTTNQPACAKLQTSNVANPVAVLPARCLLHTQHSGHNASSVWARTVLGVG